MSREVLPVLEAPGIGIASATYETTGLPATSLRNEESGESMVSPTALTLTLPIA